MYASMQADCTGLDLRDRQSSRVMAPCLNLLAKLGCSTLATQRRRLEHCRYVSGESTTSTRLLHADER